MKKFKLFALAIMAMLSTNAMAQGTSTSEWQYTVTGTNTATLKSLPNDLKGTKETINIPSTITVGETVYSITGIEANAFLNDTKITTVVIPDENVASIGANAFKGCINLSSLTIGKAVATIEASAFENCINLGPSLSFPAGSALAKLGDYAFGGTPSLTSIDFTNCASMKDFDQGAGYQKPFIASTTGNKNNYLTSITLNGETTDLGVALANVPNLATQNIKDTKITLVAASFLDGNTKITSLELPASVGTVTANALNGSVVTSLTINSHATGETINALGGEDLEAFTIKGTFKGTIADAAIKLADGAVVTIGTIGGAFAATGATPFDGGDPATVSITAVNTTATIVGIFPATMETGVMTIGNIGTAGTSPVATTLNLSMLGMPTTLQFGAIADGSKLTELLTDNETLTTLTFAGAIGTTTGGAVQGSFATSEKLATVNINALANDGAFAANAFADGTDNTVYAGSGNIAGTNTISMTVNYSPSGITAATDEPFNDAAFGLGTSVLYKVKLATTQVVIDANTTGGNLDLKNVEAGAPAATSKIELAKKDGDWYYGKFYANGSNFAISKADGIVYSAYTDEDGTIYMDQLQIVDGNYIVNANKAVVVKSKTKTEITATSTDDDGTIRCDLTGAPIDEIRYYAGATASYTVIDAAAALDQVAYALAKPASFNLTWKKFKNNITLPAGTFVIFTNEGASAGRVVWLDGSEDSATAISTVKKNAKNDGVIYNVAGQKVSAAYKGLVIKDGKKYMQK